MDKEYRKRIAKFLSEYIDINDCKYGYGDDEVIRQGIKILIESGAFTADELRKTAIKDYNIVITKQFINRCLN